MAARRLDALTGLRCAAASMIVFGHLQNIFIANYSDKVSFGQGVSIFFVLSGFILTYNYPALLTPPERWRFVAARFARVWPAYVTALILLAPAFWGANAWMWFANVTMIEAWIPDGRYGNPMNAWSISTEFGFYLLFPILIANFSSNWLLKLSAVVILTFGLIIVCTTLSVKSGYTPGDPGSNLSNVLYFNPLARLFEFVIGMCSALAWRRLGDTLSFRFSTASILESMSVLACALAATGCISRILETLPPCQYDSFRVWSFESGSSAIPAAILVFALACGRGAISRVLATRPIVFLGEISYSVFVLHQVVMWYYFRFHEHLIGYSNSTLLFGYLIVVLACSTIMWFIVERPARTALMHAADAVIKTIAERGFGVIQRGYGVNNGTEEEIDQARFNINIETKTS
jgi:peptidoglycan/LPS O-acetylase OafA/YrhL